jgi:hypothetical protein
MHPRPSFIAVVRLSYHTAPAAPVVVKQAAIPALSWRAVAFSPGGDGEIEQKLLDSHGPQRPERARAF